jgi:hypothetical protein
MICAERGVAGHTKVEKDLLQASQLVRILAEDRPGDLALSWEMAASRGKGWQRRLDRGMALLNQRHPEVHALMRDTVRHKA